MLILFTGGSGCGKSSYAEDVCARLAGSAPLYYIAAMKPFGEGSREKIERHRRMRAEIGFSTIERYTDLAGLRLPETERGSVALLECIANLTANEMFDDEGNARDPYGPVTDGVRALAAQCEHLVVVTNDVGSDGGGYGDLTEEYVRVIGRINAELAAEADTVCEMVFGCPQVIKGQMPAAAARASGELPKTEKEDRKHMLLIVGAEGSGKRTYAAGLGYPEEEMVNAENALPGQAAGLYHAEALVKGIADADARTVTKKDMDARVDEIADRLTGFEVILANEVGNGVIPLEPEVRREREAAGRLVTLLAKRAGTVVRMGSGIPAVMKGGLPRAKTSKNQ